MVWVNQSSDQYLSAADSAKLGSLCFNPLPGRYVIGGNGVNSVAYCSEKDLIPGQPALSMGGPPVALAVLAFMLLPKPYGILVAIPLAGFGVLGALWSGGM